MVTETFRAIITKQVRVNKWQNNVQALVFCSLTLLNQRYGVQGLHDMLCDEINDKTRVTKNHVVLAKMAKFLL